MVLLTDLIIRVRGKLVCQLFFVGKLLIVGLLLGNWRVEGLDKRFWRDLARNRDGSAGDGVADISHISESRCGAPGTRPLPAVDEDGMN